MDRIEELLEYNKKILQELAEAKQKIEQLENKVRQLTLEKAAISETYQTKEYRLVTYLDDKGNIYKFITNRFDLPSEKIAEIYKNRWQIELFFRYIKHQFKITKMYSTKEQGVKNQVYLTLIAILLLEHVRIRTKSPNTITIIKSYFDILKFESAEKFYQKK